MTGYITNKRYTEELEYIEEDRISNDVIVTVKGENGATFTWGTTVRSQPYKLLKKNGKGKFTFTYKNDACYDKLISNLKAV